MKPKNFFAELKRRNVYKVAVAYAVVGWLIIQIATQVFPFFDIPNWAVRLVVLTTIVGFPVALIIAWAFELTPEGLRRTETADFEEQPEQSRARTWIYVVVIAGAMALGLFAIQRFTDRYAAAKRDAILKLSEKSIAVLPFESLSEDKSNAYFASGIQNEILTRLTRIANLKVISRTSTEKYQSHPENIKAIAAELGVGALLEGSVQKNGDNVHINAQLIDAKTDAHLWAQSYDRNLQDVFAVEGEVAQTVADALKIKLLPAEVAKINTQPTQNPQAYAAFLKGEYKLHAAWTAGSASGEDPLKQAQQAYMEAIAIDSGFALAYAQLAYAQLTAYWFGVIDGKADPVPELLHQAKDNIDQSLELAPDLAAAHTYLARWHAWGYQDYAAAGAEYKRALAIEPTQSDAVLGLATISMRKGKPQEAIDRLTPALTWDPRNVLLLRNLGFGYTQNRDYTQAIETFRRILALAPDDAVDASNLADVLVLGNGDVTAASAILEALPGAAKTEPHVVAEQFHLKLLARDFEGASAFIEQTSATGFPSDWARPFNLGIAQYRLHDNDAKDSFEEAARLLEAEIAKHADQPLTHATLGKVFSYLGQPDRAVAEGQRAIDLLPISKNTLEGSQWVEALAEIQSQLGHADVAFALLKQLLDMPAGDAMSVWALKLDPVWDPLRADPRFQNLIAQASAQKRK